MNESASQHALPFTQGVIDTLLDHLEERLLKKIKTNPEKYGILTTSDTSTAANSNAVPVLFSIPEVAEKLRVSEATVRTLCHTGKLSFIRPSNRAMFVTEYDFTNYLNTISDNG